LGTMAPVPRRFSHRQDAVLLRGRPRGPIPAGVTPSPVRSATTGSHNEQVSEIGVSEAGPQDIDVVMDVYVASFVPMVRGYHPHVDERIFDEDVLRPMWQKLLLDQRSTVWLARQSSPVDAPSAAVLAVKPSSNAETLELAKLFVRPQGQSNGIGRYLTEMALNFAASGGYQYMDLWTWEVGQQGRRFYESMGFRLTSDRGVSGYPGIDPASDVTLRYERAVHGAEVDRAGMSADSLLRMPR